MANLLDTFTDLLVKAAKNQAQSKTSGSGSSSGSSKSSNTSGSYTPINSYANINVSKENYWDEVAKQEQYVADNPTAIQLMSGEERQARYGDILADVLPSGYVTGDYDQAKASADKYGVSLTPTLQNGQVKYIVGKADRTVQAGTSGADEDLLTDYDYAIIQHEKQNFADAQERYNAAKALGNAAAMAQAQADMDQAHLNAERIRAGYNYSGGQDGSMYIASGNTNYGKDIGYDSGSSGRVSGSSGSSRASGSSSGGSGSGGSGSGGGSGSVSVSVPQLGGLSASVEDYSAYLEQMYAAHKAAALAQLNAAYEQNVAALDRAQAGVAADYQAARNQTAGASELAKRNFAEYAAASGLNSGAGGQAELARNVTLQNNLNTINTAEAGTIAGLRQARANAESEYNLAIAQAQSEGDYELAAALYQEKVRVEEALIDLEIQEQKLALEQYQLEYQAQKDAEELALKRQQAGL